MTLPLIDTGKAERPQSKRRERDFYPTPDWATQALLSAFPEIRGSRMLDPTCGDGRMAQALASRFDVVLCNDIEPRPNVAQYHMDARNHLLYEEARAEWIVTNLPFNLAGPLAWMALHGASVGVALLLRCTFLEPCEGREWLTRRPPTAILALPRISFNGAGTDSAPCWWFIWGPVTPGIRVVRGDEGAQLALGGVTCSMPSSIRPCPASSMRRASCHSQSRTNS